MNKFFKFFKTHQRVRYTQPKIKYRLFQPSRDWLIGLLLFLVVVIAGSAVSAFMFLRYSEIDITPTDTTTALPRYNQAMVSEVISIYQSRADRYQSLKNGVRVVPVPPVVPATEATSSVASTTVTEVAEEQVQEATVSAPVLE